MTLNEKFEMKNFTKFITCFLSIKSLYLRSDDDDGDERTQQFVF